MAVGYHFNTTSMVKRTSPGFLFLLLLVSGCLDPGPQFVVVERATGYLPVYGSPSAAEASMSSPRPVIQPGKIYLYDKYLLLNEKMQGIHVFDNSDPSKPINLGFLELLGNTDFAIKDGVLYADHLGDIVALTINDFGTITQQGRIELEDWIQGMPPPPGFYFECIDPAKGFIVNWREVELKNPQCYALP